jgi:hypothetical protein
MRQTTTRALAWNSLLVQSKTTGMADILVVDSPVRLLWQKGQSPGESCGADFQGLRAGLRNGTGFIGPLSWLLIPPILGPVASTESSSVQRRQHVRLGVWVSLACWRCTPKTDFFTFLSCHSVQDGDRMLIRRTVRPASEVCTPRSFVIHGFASDRGKRNEPLVRV